MGDERGAGARGGERRRRPTARQRIQAAREEFEELTGVPVESVSGLERTDDGWTVTLEALELQRVPDTVSVLATYTVELDEDGELVGYRRVRSYTRGRAGRA
ncbi:gas vesicle protein GvpO [Marinitenerispora sediminis]|uniref:Gas vesicle protein n=1 Tax=Marinitenerispora sediminis TaxID=1931232 RepID=A0A368T2P2_9ACTN|nr:gas vesicle protein [Marinitenerispora sediminis]RCV47945.1 gas vesicle protein [Marinitenerispora sediminis]RCV51900.1 gas vesicle protein [Marinitenerispora sediminis]RCV55664.1 gas vesicle protein [Marinitenerispora sediminis]